VSNFQVYKEKDTNIEPNSGTGVSDSTLIIFPINLINEKTWAPIHRVWCTTCNVGHEIGNSSPGDKGISLLQQVSSPNRDEWYSNMSTLVEWMVQHLWHPTWQAMGRWCATFIHLESSGFNSWTHLRGPWALSLARSGCQFFSTQIKFFTTAKGYSLEICVLFTDGYTI
jgi:hypothetical protein